MELESGGGDRVGGGGDAELVGGGGNAELVGGGGPLWSSGAAAAGRGARATADGAWTSGEAALRRPWPRQAVMELESGGEDRVGGGGDAELVGGGGNAELVGGGGPLWSLGEAAARCGAWARRRPWARRLVVDLGRGGALASGGSPSSSERAAVELGGDFKERQRQGGDAIHLPWPP
ncbi:hypothetical protein ACP4OV_031643 [Aristida adscensionis]